jgi:hypothetical protein
MFELIWVTQILDLFWVTQNPTRNICWFIRDPTFLKIQSITSSQPIYTYEPDGKASNLKLLRGRSMVESWGWNSDSWDVLMVSMHGTRRVHLQIPIPLPWGFSCMCVCMWERERERSTCHTSNSSLSIRNLPFSQENAGEDDRALNSEQVILHHQNMHVILRQSPTCSSSLRKSVYNW